MNWAIKHPDPDDPTRSSLAHREDPRRDDITEDDGDDFERHRCDECCGEGFLEYNDAGPSYWGEDCASEINHLVTCRACHGTGVVT